MVSIAMNQTANESRNDLMTQELIEQYFLIGNLLLAAVSIVLNGFTILFTVGSSRLRKQHNIFTFNMALMDTVCGLYVLYVLTSTNFQDIHVTIWGSFMVTSSLNILLVAVYRFLTVHVDPFGVGNLVTTSRCVFACVIVWVIGTFPLLGNLVDGALKWILACVLIIFILTAICYALLYRGVTRSKVGQQRVDVDEQRLKENRRLLMTFAAIYITSISFWIPGFAFGFLRSKTIWFARIAATSAQVNLIVNPVIYWLRSNEFKAEVKGCLFKTYVVPVMV